MTETQNILYNLSASESIDNRKLIHLAKLMYIGDSQNIPSIGKPARSPKAQDFKKSQMIRRKRAKKNSGDSTTSKSAAIIIKDYAKEINEDSQVLTFFAKPVLSPRTQDFKKLIREAQKIMKKKTKNNSSDSTTSKPATIIIKDYAKEINEDSQILPFFDKSALSPKTQDFKKLIREAQKIIKKNCDDSTTSKPAAIIIKDDTIGVTMNIPQVLPFFDKSALSSKTQDFKKLIREAQKIMKKKAKKDSDDSITSKPVALSIKDNFTKVEINEDSQVLPFFDKPAVSPRTQDFKKLIREAQKIMKKKTKKNNGDSITLFPAKIILKENTTEIGINEVPRKIPSIGKPALSPKAQDFKKAKKNSYDSVKSKPVETTLEGEIFY